MLVLDGIGPLIFLSTEEAGHEKDGVEIKDGGCSNILRILVPFRYQIRLTSNSGSVAVAAVKRYTEYLEARQPDRVDLGVFFSRILVK